MQGSWDDTDPGQTVTINCQKKHVRDGSFERTCNSDVMWNDEAPLCRKLSKFEPLTGKFLKVGLFGVN